jgi:4-oxalocrotonate tautomerase
MPMLTVLLAAAPSADLSQRVAHSLTDLTTTVLHKDPDVTTIAIQYVDPERWFVYGTRTTPAYFVEIRVTEGTNTKDEKAEYIARSHAALESLLGGSGPASYVQIMDVHADAYGFGGLTAERRYVTSRLLPTPV